MHLLNGMVAILIFTLAFTASLAHSARDEGATDLRDKGTTDLERSPPKTPIKSWFELFLNNSHLRLDIIFIGDGAVLRTTFCGRSACTKIH